MCEWTYFFLEIDSVPRVVKPKEIESIEKWALCFKINSKLTDINRFLSR